MADLNIIYRIAADISGLQDGVNRAAKSTEKLESLASKVTTAFAGMFTVTAAISFGKQLLDDADALVKLSDQTGVSIAGLQRFQVAGDDAGNTVDDLTNAITKLEDKLAGGDKSALAALQKLGIPFEDIKNLSPENQFIAISDAIRQIHDPAQQVNIAMDLFGKSGATILPTLKRGFDDVKGAAVGMSESTARELDSLGDSLSAAWRTTKGFTADAVVFLAQIRFWGDPISQARHEIGLFNDELARMLANIKAAPSLPQMGPLQVPTSDSPDVARSIREVDEALRKQQQARHQAAEEAKRDERELKDALELINDVHIGEIGLRQLDDQILIAEQRTIELRQTLLKIDTSMVRDASDAFRGLGEEIESVPDELFKEWGIRFTDDFIGPVWDGVEAVKSFGATLKDVLSNSLGGLNDIFQRAFEGGGGVTGAVKSFATNFAAGLLDMIPVIGPYLSQFAGAIVSGLSKLFGNLFGGPSEEELAGRDLVSSFEDDIAKNLTAQQRLEAGGESWKETVIGVRDAYREVGLSEQQALDDVSRLWDASKEGPEAVKRVIDEISAHLDDAKRHQEALNDETAKGGDAAKEAATQSNAVLDALMKRREDLAASVANEAPEEVMGVIESQTRGQIAALDTAIEQQQSELERQAAELADTIESELNDINPDIVTIDYEYRLHGLPPWTQDFPGSGELPEPIPMATGGMGTVTRPTLFMAGESGPEHFQFTPVGRSGSGGSQAPTVINNYFNGILTDGPAVKRALDETVGQWMPDAIVRDVGGIRRSIRRTAAVTP